MRKDVLRAGLLAVALALAAGAGPAEAQGRRGMQGSDMFAGMSPEGRRVMSAALLDSRSDPLRAQVEAAHEATLRLLEADPLDREALARAMQEEDALLARQLEARRERLLEAFAKLSAADRRAWAAGNRARRAEMPGRGLGRP
ncbi:periplasmic heavy metal sensor [Thermaurantiacus tibetensis]|uniref:periplasmic heavy metal sensor n=1 Tax=Thermaurantiacus tibetensis TaxID=2759035 RepID=UPI00188E02B6|nr:periplasmic heavy metal sensor [Thermaurantiacus tibetensis]